MRSGSDVAVARLALGERDALVQPQNRVLGPHLHLVEQLRRGLVFDDDGDVLHLAGEARRDRVDRLGDQRFELLAGHLGSFVA